MMDYVSVKLSTGETVIGVLTDQSVESYYIACPMLVKYHSVLIPPGKVVEHLTASPYMRLTDDLNFPFQRHHVVAVQPLNEQGINIFINLLDEHHDTYTLKQNGVLEFVEDRLNKLTAEKAKLETLDDVNKSLDLIKAIIDKRREQEKEPIEQELKPEDISKGRIIH